VDDRVAVDVVDEGHQPLLEFVFRVDPDVAQYERANLEKKPSMILSQDPWVGVKVKAKRPIGCAANQLVVSRET
jgi:hypothetical protein